MRPAARLFALLALLAGAAATLLVACGDDGGGNTVFTIAIVTPEGGDPLGGVDTARVAVKQGEADTEVVEEPVGPEGFDIRLPVTDQLTPVAVTVELEGDDVRRVGAPPPFSPAELFAASLVIPVGSPGTCGRLLEASLGTGRVAPGLSRHGTFALVIGGEAADGPSAQAGFLDLIDYARGDFASLPDPLGRARAIRYSTARSIVLSEGAEPFRYDIGSASNPVLSGGLHEGAGAASGALALGSLGAVVVGGETGGVPVDGVSWVDSDGGTVITGLSVPRARPAVALVGTDLLVIGGNDGGAWAELIERGVATGAALDPVPDGERRGAVLVSDPSTRRALLVGGVDGAGDPRTDTVLFDCSADCVSEPGPDWARARTGAAAVALPAGGGLLVGGDGPVAQVDRVLFDEAGARIDGWGDLDAPRSEPSVLALPSGVVYVVGGEGADGPREDVEVCFPEDPVIAF